MRWLFFSFIHKHDCMMMELVLAKCKPLLCTYTLHIDSSIALIASCTFTLLTFRDNHNNCLSFLVQITIACSNIINGLIFYFKMSGRTFSHNFFSYKWLVWLLLLKLSYIVYSHFFRKIMSYFCTFSLTNYIQFIWFCLIQEIERGIAHETC